MAKLVVFLSLLLLVLCCVTFVSCKAPSWNPIEFIQVCCLQTSNARLNNLCLKELTPFATEMQGDYKRVATRAVSITKDKVESSIKLLNKLKHDKSTNGAAAKVVDSCLLKFTQDAEQIARAEASLKSIGGQGKSSNDSYLNDRLNVSNWLSGSKDNATSCVSDMNSTNLGDSYKNSLQDVSDTIWYTYDLVNIVYFQSLTPHAPQTYIQPKYAHSPDPWADFIKETCGRAAATTSYASQCEDDMLPAVPSDANMDEKTVTFLAVNVSVKKANSFISYMNGIISNNNTTQKDRQAAKRCAGGIRTAFIPLDKTKDKNPTSLPNLKGFLQGIKASENDCLSLAKKFQVNTSSVADTANSALQSTNIAVALVDDYFKPKGKKMQATS